MSSKPVCEQDLPQKPTKPANSPVGGVLPVDKVSGNRSPKPDCKSELPEKPTKPEAPQKPAKPATLPVGGVSPGGQNFMDSMIKCKPGLPQKPTRPTTSPTGGVTPIDQGTKSPNSDSKPAATQKPTKSVAPPMGGVSLFGPNTGILGEMKSRLKNTDPVEEAQPNSEAPKGENKNGLEATKSPDHQTVQNNATSPKPSEHAGPVRMSSKTPSESPFRQHSTGERSPTGDDKVEENKVTLHPHHPVATDGDNRLSALFGSRARGPSKRPPTIRRSMVIDASNVIASGESDLKQCNTSPTAAPAGDTEERNNNVLLDSFFGCTEVD